MPELKPCPMCGCDAREYVDNNGLIIKCNGCGLQIYRAFVPAAEWEQAGFKCREAWNKRSKEKETKCQEPSASN